MTTNETGHQAVASEVAGETSQLVRLELPGSKTSKPHVQGKRPKPLQRLRSFAELRILVEEEAN